MEHEVAPGIIPAISLGENIKGKKQILQGICNDVLFKQQLLLETMVKILSAQTRLQEHLNDRYYKQHYKFLQKYLLWRKNGVSQVQPFTAA